MISAQSAITSVFAKTASGDSYLFARLGPLSPEGVSEALIEEIGDDAGWVEDVLVVHTDPTTGNSTDGTWADNIIAAYRATVDG